MRLDVTVTTSDGLPEVEGRLDNPQPALARIAEDIHSREAQVFATADWGSWDPLAASTIARKGSSRILISTGALQRSLTTRAGIVRISRDELFVGTSSPSATLARTGTRFRPKRDPAPPPTRAEADRWAGMLAVYVADG